MTDTTEAIERCCEVVADVLAENMTDYAGICRISEVLLPWANPSVHSAPKDAERDWYDALSPVWDSLWTIAQESELQAGYKNPRYDMTHDHIFEHAWSALETLKELIGTPSMFRTGYVALEEKSDDRASTGPKGERRMYRDNRLIDPVDAVIADRAMADKIDPPDDGKAADAHMPGVNPVWCGRTFPHPAHITVPGSAWCAGEPTAAHHESTPSRSSLKREAVQRGEPMPSFDDAGAERFKLRTGTVELDYDPEEKPDGTLVDPIAAEYHRGFTAGFAHAQAVAPEPGDSAPDGPFTGPEPRNPWRDALKRLVDAIGRDKDHGEFEGPETDFAIGVVGALLAEGTA